MLDVLAPDTIRAIDAPSFEATREADRAGREPVVVVTTGGEARAYPVAILVRHEIVNDRIGDQALVVAYSPLTDASAVYERTAGGRTLRFGVSGKLYLGTSVLFDRETASLWPQTMGVAVAGDLQGQTLRRLDAAVAPFSAFARAHPRGLVMRAPPGRRYDETPYPGYETTPGPFEDFLAGRQPDGRLPRMERVAGVRAGGRARAYPFARLRALGSTAVVHDTVGGVDVVVIWTQHMASVLDGSRIADAADAGAAAAFSPLVEGKRLRFETRGDTVVDAGTGSRWNVLGVAVDGPLRGRRLGAVDSRTMFWFAWSALAPATEVWG